LACGKAKAPKGTQQYRKATKGKAVREKEKPREKPHSPDKSFSEGDGIGTAGSG
jgi:hypothetical protein